MAITSLGYANTTELYKLALSKEVTLKSNIVEDVMNKISKNITNMKEEIEVEVIQMELSLIFIFINKNLEIVKCEQSILEKKPRLKSEITSRFVNQQAFDRLEVLQRTVNKEQFIKELGQSYIRGCISAYEVHCLLLQNTSENN